MSGGKLLVRGARQAVLVCRAGERALRGEEMKTLASLEQDGDNGVSLVVGSNGLIEAVGHDADIQQKYGSTKFDRVIDAAGMSILPGLIDGHTHPVWAGDRVHEFAMKLAGATYMEVHKAGGGINFTVEHTRRASEDELYTLFRDRLLRMVRAGTTLVECKSGYGLEVETEMKMLRVIQRAKRELPIEISSTFCGAHSVPRGSTMEQATDDVINVQLPRLRELMKSGDLEVDNIDVFCEKGVFDVDSTRRILQAGVETGLAINFHGDELHPMNSAELGAELKARAISHLEEISDAGIKAMADSGSVAVILPTTAYILRLTPPPARKMIDSGVVVALGSDFNPNAFCLSMPMTMHLACVNFRMSMNESLAAATINAAASLGRAETHGSLEVGKVGDLVIIDAPRWEHLIYQLAGHDHLIKYVVKKGEVIHSAA
ncbi:PREDICTED: probable imidazolonepropionase [Branchiostoma belcheri]|uniref:Probable imidazolonepropionase n=1 Tax=Branchiostoma belcheri TaxID=7741 RepID=A0A6P4YLR8_BRABE|nr:PREDICTED: probable imidazolonepropionase [Branchiostoma belcheri]